MKTQWTPLRSLVCSSLFAPLQLRSELYFIEGLMTDFSLLGHHSVVLTVG